MSRKGLNCTFVYSAGGRSLGYRLRASSVSHGLAVVGTESSARIRKVFYPHHLTMSNFSVTVDLIGETEYKSFSNWMANYLEYAMTKGTNAATFPAMTVIIPSHRFQKRGIPLSGYTWGDTVGRMVWTQQIPFLGIEDNRENQTYVRSRVEGYSSANKPFYPQPDKNASTVETIVKATGAANVTYDMGGE